MKMDNLNIDINFFPFEKQDFDFTIYVKEYTSDQKKIDSFNFETKRFNLAINNTGDYKKYYVSYEKQEGFEKTNIHSTNNNWLTIWYIKKKIFENGKNNNIETFQEKKYENCINVVYKTHNEGYETFSIVPKYIKKQLGLIIKFHFRKSANCHSSKEIQKLSLSLDLTGRPNKNYYSDKYIKIMTFVNSTIFDTLNKNDDSTNFISSLKMLEITGDRLNAKKYVFGGNKIDFSQFKGIVSNGPYQTYSGKPILCFVYSIGNKDLSHTLYYALNGKMYPTFTGMEKMFQFPMNKDNVIGISVNDYSENEIKNLVIDIKEKSSGRPIIPIILVPWTREKATDEESKLYHLIKHHLIKEAIPSQFVGISNVNNYESLKWSVSSIGLQLFTKLGGYPWCLEVSSKKSLIIGIGQSHKRNRQNKIERYFSYSIMTDSSGIFRDIKSLSENSDEKEYLNGLTKRLREIIQTEISNFDNIVIHTSFSLQKKEVERINDTVKLLKDETNKKFMVIRFSSKHHYMGFNLSANSRTPFESTFVKINSKEYLVWFEGLSSTTHTIKTRIGPPMHLKIDFPSEPNFNDVMNNLQDAINLSGANWRGFNAKAMPVSILYSRLLSSFIAAFDENELESIDIEQLTPWFL